MVIAMPPIVVKKGSIREKFNLFTLFFPTIHDVSPPIVVDAENLDTAERCLAAVQKEGCALKFVPKKFKSPELCLAAVRNNRYALQFVPEKIKTPEFMEKIKE